VLRVGLTGGIGAGKSAVAARLARLGAIVVDHDELAREAVAPGSVGLRAVVAAFGEVLDALGQLDRGVLGERVFGDPAALATLNGIIHPIVTEAAAEAEEAAVAAGHRIVVHEVPLLVETGQAGRFDVLVVVDAPPELRVKRLVADRGMTAEEAWARLAAQADDEERLEVADVVIDGAGPLAELDVQVDALWERWAHARANGSDRAVDHTADGTADPAAEHTPDRVAVHAPDHAADRTADDAAGHVADRTADRA
jgi:dephospho-CoA kinase